MTQAIEKPFHILQQILERIAQPRPLGLSRLAVFDLDSTLFDVSPRLQKVLEDFALNPAYQKQFPEAMPFFQQIKAEKTDWGIRQALERSGLKDAGPEFQNTIRDFWRTAFFSDSYLQYDIPYEGAVEFVKKIYDSGVEIIYLTGRDQHRMGLGSPEILRKWEFPLDGAQAHLVLKPDRSMDDAIFKKDWFLKLPKDTYEVIWFFENEPVNIHLVRKEVPEIDIIFFDSTHSRQALPPDDLPMIKHFIIDSYKVSKPLQKKKT